MLALLAIEALGALAACRRGGAAEPQPACEVRKEAGDALEEWHATTRAPVPAGRATVWVTIDETVKIDAAGRLVFAETRLHDDISTPETRVVFDPPHHRVALDRAGRHVEWSVPGDEPWILAPAATPFGSPVATPLVAWVTYRAAERHASLRLVRPLDQESFVVPRDQYVVDQTVVIGDQAVEVDESFVRGITIGGVELARGVVGTAFRFRGG